MDSINQFFLFKDLENDFSIEENYYLLKKKLSYLQEFKNDILTIKLILNLYLYNANSLMKKQELRNIKDELFVILKNHDTFRYFLYNNHIEDKILLKLIPYLKYKYFTKNEIICKEGEDSLNMYFILKGKVSLIKDSNKLNIISIIKENENFGQWDIIYHRKRKLSYYALDDCHIISINKDKLRKYLQEKLIKGDDELKSFATKFLKKNGISVFFRIERIIKNMKLLYFRKDEIIYNEGEKNTNIYLIYKGEAKLVKKIIDGEFNFIRNLKENILKIQEKAKNLNYKDLIFNEFDKEIKDKNNYYQKNLMEKSEYRTLIILGKGSVGGAEISTGIINKKYTFLANSDYTTILKIELKYMKENLNRFLISLLPIFIQIEKEIHLRFKQIKNIDNMIPENCQIYKIKNDKIDKNSINQLDNDRTFIKEIKKINQKFEVNEGGFIQMNDFNMNLNHKKNKLKEQLIENKQKNIKINSLIKKYKEKEEFKEIDKGLKMLKKHFSFKVNKNINNKIIFEKDLSSKRRYLMTPKNYRNYLFKNRSEKYFAKKTLKIFDEVIEKYRKTKDFFLIDLYAPQVIKTEKITENKKTIESQVQDNKLLKEVVIIDKKKYHSIEESKDKQNFRIKRRIIKLQNQNLKKALKDIDKDDDEICIINKNILRKFFEKNMIKNERNKRKNSLNIKYRTFSQKRMIYYNTGMYDMPFVFHLNTKNN